MKRSLFLFTALLLLVGSCLAQYSFTTVDYPGAAATRLVGLNDHFDMVGHYILPGQVRHAMMYSHGVFTPLDQNGVLGMNPSAANQINNRGDITGWYSQGGKRHGYLLSNGVVTTIDYPGSVSGQVNGVSDDGLVIGQFQNQDGIVHGFTYRDGVFTQMDLPGAVDTIPFYVNARGDIAGEWDPNPKVVGHGFVLTSTGEAISFDVPGAPDNSTLAIGINDRRDILGAYLSPTIYIPTLISSTYRPTCVPATRYLYHQQHEIDGHPHNQQNVGHKQSAEVEIKLELCLANLTHRSRSPSPLSVAGVKPENARGRISQNQPWQTTRHRRRLIPGFRRGGNGSRPTTPSQS